MKNRLIWNALTLVTLAAAATTARAQLDPNNFTSLGSLVVGTGDTVVIDTTAGTISINGTPTYAGVTQTQSGAASLSVFTFTSVSIASGATITLQGSNPLALLSQGNASIASGFDASGGAGSNTLGSTTPGNGVLGGGNGGAGSAVPGGDASPGASTINSNGGHSFHNPDPNGDPVVISYDGGGGGNGGVGGPGGSGAGNASGVSPKTKLVGGGGGGGGAYLVATTAGPQPGAGGGAGGGAVEIVAVGSLTVSDLNSNGGAGGGPNPVNSGNQYGGGGAGGAVLLSGSSLTVTGSVNANGGSPVPNTGAGAGGGGAATLIGTPSFVLGSTAAGGLGVNVSVAAGTSTFSNTANAGAIEATTVGITAPTGQTATYNGTAFTNVAPSQAQTATDPSIAITFGKDLVLDGGNLQFTGNNLTYSHNLSVTSNNGTVDTAANNETISSNITGTGGLFKNGTGMLTLSGNNNYQGGLQINAGTVVVASSNALGQGGFTNVGGTVQTGGGNHIITVGGDFDISSGANLVVTLNAAPGSASNDQVQVTTGQAHLDGNLAINYNGPHLAVGASETYTIVQTGGGVVSAGPGFTIPTLRQGAVFFDATGAINGNDFDVTLTAVQGTFGSIGGFTPNQQHVADYLDRVVSSGASNPGLNALISELDNVSANNVALASALNSLMPLNFHTFASTNAFNSTDFVVEQMDNYLAGHRGVDGNFIASADHLDTTGFSVAGAGTAQGLQGISSRLLAWNPAPSTGLLSDTPSPSLGGVDLRKGTDSKSMRVTTTEPQPWNVFVAGDAVLAQNFSDDSVGAAHGDSTTGEVRVGADYTITPNFLVGLLADFAHTDDTLDNEHSRATIDSYMPAAYASFSDQGWYANAIGGYAWNAYTQHRNVLVGTLGGRADSAPTGGQILGNLDGGYDFHSGPWTFGPTLGVKYVHLDINGYTENGMPGGSLVVNRDEADSLRSRLGGRVSYVLQDGDLQFVPHFDISWVHEFMDSSRGIDSQFVGVSAGTFTVDTASPSRDSALMTLGLDAKIDSTFTVFGNYSVQAGQDNYFGQAVQAGVKIGF